ncbi:MAG: trigger factor [Bacteroidales bacterium]|nr:trigger factor [Bacteroidales bacterium]
MKVNEKKIDALNREVSLQIVAEDYAQKKKTRLAEYRRKAEIKGFRKGMVPASLIEKMYGQAVLVDAVQDCISEGLSEYINNNSLKVVGEPLPVEDGPKNEWVDGNEFNFVFDLATNPEVALELGKDDEVPYYTIKAEAKAKAEMKANMLKQYGTLEEGVEAKAEDFIIVDFEQEGMKVEGAYVALRNVAEDIRPAFVGVKVGDVLNVNVNEAFLNEADRAAMLKLKKEDLATLNPEFTVTVKNVKTFVDAPVCQETFDKIFGEGVVKSEDEFDAQIEERLKAEYAREADYRFQKDLKDYLVAKAGLEIPEKFLKRWIFVANDGKFTMEEIEKEWPMFVEDYKWQLIRDWAMEKYSVKVEEADLMASAKGYAAYQFAMYGMNNVPDEQLESFAKSILSQEKESRRIVEQVENEKTLAAVREVVSMKKKSITVAKFRELA